MRAETEKSRLDIKIIFSRKKLSMLGLNFKLLKLSASKNLTSKFKKRNNASPHSNDRLNMKKAFVQ